MYCRLMLIYTQCDWFNEWRTEKRHECANMGKVKRLELWWQLYRTSFPVWDLENFWPMDFCWHECTNWVILCLWHHMLYLSALPNCNPPDIPQNYVQTALMLWVSDPCSRPVPKIPAVHHGSTTATHTAGDNVLLWRSHLLRMLKPSGLIHRHAICEALLRTELPQCLLKKPNRAHVRVNCGRHGLEGNRHKHQNQF